MSLFVNGVKEATGSNGTSIPAHADAPGIGAEASQTVFGPQENEWGGKIQFLTSVHWAIPDALIYEWMRDPFGLVRMADDYAAWKAAVAGGLSIPVAMHHYRRMRAA